MDVEVVEQPILIDVAAADRVFVPPLVGGGKILSGGLFERFLLKPVTSGMNGTAAKLW